MGARRILVANELTSYRQTIAIVFRELYPGVEVREVDLQVALFAHKGQDKPAVFDITLNRVRDGGHSRWLVSSFLPTPSNGGGIGQGPNRANLFGAPAPKTATSGRVWLLIPAMLFGLLLLVVGGLGVRGWHAARLYRAYARQD